ncbi:MAG: hypothetical protein ACK58L_09100 [Planctomycetota bacterium]
MSYAARNGNLAGDMSAFGERGVSTCCGFSIAPSWRVGGTTELTSPAPLFDLSIGI